MFVCVCVKHTTLAMNAIVSHITIETRPTCVTPVALSFPTMNSVILVRHEFHQAHELLES